MLSGPARLTASLASRQTSGRCAARTGELREAPWRSSRDEVPPKVPPKVPPSAQHSMRGVLCGAFCTGSCPAEAGGTAFTLRKPGGQYKPPFRAARRVGPFGLLGRPPARAAARASYSSPANHPSTDLFGKALWRQQAFDGSRGFGTWPSRREHGRDGNSTRIDLDHRGGEYYNIR